MPDDNCRRNYKILEPHARQIIDAQSRDGNVSRITDGVVGSHSEHGGIVGTLT